MTPLRGSEKTLTLPECRRYATIGTLFILGYYKANLTFSYSTLMKKHILLPLLLLASGLFAQTQRSGALPSTGPMPNPTNPTQLGDFQPPTIVCLNGLSVNIMPTGMITLWASDFLQYVSDNATPVGSIKIGIRKVGTGTGFPFDSQFPQQPVTSLTLICDDMGTDSIELWAMDASGNTAFCTTSLLVFDNLGNCPGNNTINVSMCAKVMCSGASIEEVVFSVDGTSNFVPPFSYFDLSDANGCMNMFNSIPLDSDFFVTPDKDDNPLNGMDEQDFTLLSKHINGTQPFTEPWQWVAADANRDGLVTLDDSLEFRKLILGIYTELPNNVSWRFVPQGYQFPSPNPLSQPFPESLSVVNILADMDSVFLGIKIGDLDCSSIPNFNSQPNGERGNLNLAEKTDPSSDPTQLGDFAPPTITCVNGVSVNIMPSGMVNLWAPDFLLSATDNATPEDQLKFAVRKAGTGTGFPLDALGNPLFNTVFACNELGTNGVELWAKDLAGNTAHCLTYVIVQDNLGNCIGQPTNWVIQICAKTEQTDGIEEAQYDIVGSNPNGPFYVNELVGPNSACGYFEVPLGSDVTCAPVKDDNPLNGVTTYDLVLISKHVHGIEPLNSPYKIIAADANRDGMVTLEDSVELYKLILGIYTELPNNTSWRFVDKSFTFPNANNPFETSFPESITVQNIQSVLWADFVAIKVGDVNNTAIANMNLEPVERSAPQETPTATIGQPSPNPADGAASLPVYLPNAENLHLEISDLSGKVLWVNDLQLEKGSHALEIPALAMPGAGVYVWRVKLGDLVRAGKLLRL